MNNNFWTKIIKKAWDHYSNDVGKSLIHLGAVGWLFSSLAQLGMIITNKSFQKKDKKFLIPQETTDMIINVGLYYTICQKIKNWGDKVIETAKYITPKTAEFINALKPQNTTIENFINTTIEELKNTGHLENIHPQNILSNFYKGLIKKLESINPTEFADKSIDAKTQLEKLFNTQNINTLLNNTKLAENDFLSFKNGVGVLTAVGASVLACNLVTPIVRNITANFFQKKALKNKQDTITSPAIQTNNITKPITQPYNRPNYTVSKTFDLFKF